jgi:hypothetical protein
MFAVTAIAGGIVAALASFPGPLIELVGEISKSGHSEQQLRVSGTGNHSITGAKNQISSHFSTASIAASSTDPEGTHSLTRSGVSAARGLARNSSRMRMHQAPISTVIVVLDENDEVDSKAH